MVSSSVVVAVRHGQLRTRRSEVFLNYADHGEKDADHVIAYYFWVIRSAERTIVIDTGFSRAAAERRGRQILIDPAEAFQLLGLRPDSDIDVVLTHGHYDHIGNTAWFQSARIHMARAEFDFWHSPIAHAPSFRRLVEDDELAHLKTLAAKGRLRLIEQETTLAPGVSLLLGPGHTPGELMVRVRTTEGDVLLTSDAVHFDEELVRDMPFRHMCDLASSHDTYRRIRGLIDSGEVTHVIAGHESSVAASFPSIHGPLEPFAVVIGDDPEHPISTQLTEKRETP